MGVLTRCQGEDCVWQVQNFCHRYCNFDHSNRCILLIFVKNLRYVNRQNDRRNVQRRGFDYTTEKEWNFKGEVPAIIDFYADWCGPCKMVAPIMEELSEEYKDKLVVYKVDTEVEMELSSIFGIRSIPSLLFIPTEGRPMMQAGALSKAALKSIIEKELVKN